MPSFTSTVVALACAGAALAKPMRGLAYNNASWAEEFSQFSSISWAYNWGYPSNGLDSKWEFVPMLWGSPASDSGYQASWAAETAAASGSGTTALLAFNEPDLNNMSPETAASLYATYMQPYAGQYRLGAPAVTNGGAPLGLTWLDEFLGNCTQCTIDFVPIHWYAGWNQPDYFSDYVQQAYAAAGNRPIWITEFEGQGTDDQQVQFINAVLPWLDSLDYVERYSYFGVFNDLLLNSDGSGLSGSGQAYGSSSAVNATKPTTQL